MLTKSLHTITVIRRIAALPMAPTGYAVGALGRVRHALDVLGYHDVTSDDPVMAKAIQLVARDMVQS